MGYVAPLGLNRTFWGQLPPAYAGGYRDFAPFGATSSWFFVSFVVKKRVSVPASLFLLQKAISTGEMKIVPDETLSPFDETLSPFGETLSPFGGTLSPFDEIFAEKSLKSLNLTAN
jgi:hypothetical protein